MESYTIDTTEGLSKIIKQCSQDCNIKLNLEIDIEYSEIGNECPILEIKDCEGEDLCRCRLINKDGNIEIHVTGKYEKILENTYDDVFNFYKEFIHKDIHWRC